MTLRMKASLVAVLVVFSSCGIRLPPPEPLCSAPLAKPRFVATLLAPVGQPGVFPVFGPPGCTRALATEVHADGPNGVRIDGLVATVANEQNIEADTAILRQAQVNFTPPETGIWTISVQWSTGEVSTRRMQVHPGELSMSLRRFVDRMDTCGAGPFRTLDGLVFCQRDTTVWVYRFDGTVDHSFPGTELTVSGNEVWSNAAERLEHRTDVQGQLRLDGALPTGPTTGSMGETLPGVAFRLVIVGTGLQLLEARWDGSQLTSQLHPAPDKSRLMLYERGSIWGVDVPICLIEPGCQLTQCPAVFTCASNSFNSFSQAGIDAVWKFEPTERLATLMAFPRPLSVNSPARELMVASEVTEANVRIAPERPRMLSEQLVIAPRLEGEQFRLTVFSVEGRLLSMTDDWVITNARSPFILLFARTPQQ